MRVLAITNLFPNGVDPLAAPFNRQQFAVLAGLCRLDILAPVPWYPGARRLAPRSAAGRLARLPRREAVAGLDVRHPRFLHLPRVARGAAGLFYAASLAPVVERWRGRVDVILGAWAFPDGQAAVILGRLLRVPVVVKLHGSDINALARLPGPRRGLRWTLPRASRVVAVSRPLAREAARLGAAPARVVLVPNGVDRARFRPADRRAARLALGRDPGERLVLFVGALKAEKGAADAIEGFALAAARDPRLRLVLVGDGADRPACERRAAPLGSRVHFAGPRPPDEVARWLAACDCLTLPSWAEGTPNVVLEAIASGRRVVATRVGGIPDLLRDPRLGELVPPRAPAALGRALARVAGTAYDQAEVARVAAVPGWRESGEALHRVLAAAAAEGRRATAPGPCP